MARNTVTMFKGLGFGLAAGAMIGIIGSTVLKDNKKSKKRINRALGTVEGVIESIQDIFR